MESKYNARLRRPRMEKELGVKSLTEIYKDLYLNHSMSAPEIEEYIKNLIGESMTPRSIQRDLKKHGIEMRDIREAFHLAMAKGRVAWKPKCENPNTRYKRKKIGHKLRYETLKRYGFKCAICGVGKENAWLEVDHIIAICNGGMNNPENLQILCSDCNIGKRISEDVSSEGTLVSSKNKD